jgi:methionyl-tRNA formyltransferase
VLLNRISKPGATALAAIEREMKPLRIVFLGSDPIALPMLEWLMGEGRSIGEIVAVFTQPDRAVGRGQKITANEIKLWAQAKGLPVLQPEKLTEEVRLQLAGFDADLSLVMAYGHILRDEFIATPRLGTVNLHASILPKYRGASPIQTAIANGEKETGVSFMRIVRRLDAGPVADVERVAITPLDTALEIEAKMAASCVPLLRRTLPALSAGLLEFLPQDDASATYCRRLVKEDGGLNFAASASVLAARINGLFPWPACSVEVNGQSVKIGLADVVSEEPGIEKTISPAQPGEVLAMDVEGLRVETGQGVLRLRRLQRPSGKMLNAAEFLRGFPVAVGTRLPSRAMPALVGTVPFRK